MTDTGRERQTMKLIAKYEKLRALELALFRSIDMIDRRLIELEGQLPDDYIHPDDNRREWADQANGHA